MKRGLSRAHRWDINPQAYRRCSQCRKYKPRTTAFFYRRPGEDQWDQMCRDCRGKYQKSWYRKHRAERLAYQRDYYHKIRKFCDEKDRLTELVKELSRVRQ